MAVSHLEMIRYKVGGVELRVPTDGTGYEVRSSDETSVAFREQYFSGSTRVSDVDPKILKRADGTPVVAVLTTILDRPSSNAVHGAVEQQLANKMASLLQHDSVALTIDLPVEGPTKFAFTKPEDGKIVGKTELGSRYKYWVVALREKSIDYLLGCEFREAGGRLQFVCDGELRLGRTSAAVLLIGETLAEIPVAFESNRTIVQSFVVP
jgi:hypothetical protein